MKTGILFDMDGVLMDTDRYHFQAWRELGRELGLPFTREQGDRCRGISRMASLEVLLEGAGRNYTPAEKAELAEEKNRRYRQLLASLTPGDVPPSVARVLPELRRRGYRLAVASSSRNAGLIVERTGLDRWVEAVADGTRVTRSKPDPEVFLAAAGMLGLEPGDCAAVDDALSGIEAARRAGMVPIAVGSAAVHQAGDWNLERLEELLALFPPREGTP